MDEDCGHEKFCFNEDPYNQAKGVCIKWFGIPKGKKAIFTFDGDNWNRDESDAYLLCETYFANSNGDCDLGYTVESKGKACSADEDCPNSFGQPGKCKCKMDASNLPEKVCDVGTEDYEWQIVRKKFATYMAATKYCHTSQRLGRCQRTKEWKDWKCHETKAKYFSYLANHTECFTNFRGHNDFISDYNYFCNYAHLLKLLSLHLVILFVIIY